MKTKISSTEVLKVVVLQARTIPEIVGDCGELVDLYSDDCVEQFTEKVLASFDKGRNHKAIERSLHFTWEKTANETVKVYEELL